MGNFQFVAKVQKYFIYFNRHLRYSIYLLFFLYLYHLNLKIIFNESFLATNENDLKSNLHNIYIKKSYISAYALLTKISFIRKSKYIKLILTHHPLPFSPIFTQP